MSKRAKFSEVIGLENTSNKGQKMTIVSGTCCRDLDVMFEDGTLVHHKTFPNFQSGNIINPNLRKGNYIGMRAIASNGMEIEVIDATGHDDITVRFIDGQVVYHKCFAAFKRGEIRHPERTATLKFAAENRVGKVVRSKCGQNMTLIAWASSKDITVQFEDGTIVEHKSFGDFNIGDIGHPNFKQADRTVAECAKKYLGTKNQMKCGLVATVVAYRGTDDIDIQFDDGVVVTCMMKSFKKGCVPHPNITENYKQSALRSQRNGTVHKSKDGWTFTILNYEDANNVKIKFDSGYTSTVKWRDIKSGHVFDPLSSEDGLLHKVMNTDMKVRFVYKDSKHRYFHCNCSKCNLDYILSDNEVAEHLC